MQVVTLSTGKSLLISKTHPHHRFLRLLLEPLITPSFPSHWKNLAEGQDNHKICFLLKMPFSSVSHCTRILKVAFLGVSTLINSPLSPCSFYTYS